MKDYSKHFPADPEFNKHFAQAIARARLTTPEREALFLATIAHESAHLTKLEENLRSYTPKRLMEVWPARFEEKVYGVRNGKRVVIGKKPNAKAVRVAGHSMLTAEAVYGGRMGNAPEGRGEGWLYRGRGAIMSTGKTNYARISKSLGLADLVKQPELVAAPEYALLTAAEWWRLNKMNEFADELAEHSNVVDSIERTQFIWAILQAARKKVNGGLIGFDHFKNLYESFLK